MTLEIGMTVSITCFHTCDNRGTKDEILSKVPFKSNSGNPEWLGKGYYFWTDVDHHAHIWGQIKPRLGSYVIVKFQIDIEKDDLLDLVGDAGALLFFRKLMSDYKEHLVKKVRNAKTRTDKSKLEDELSNVSVSTVIQFYRDEKILNYKAMKSQDINNKKIEGLSYLKGKSEILPFTRHQLVVYEEGKNLLSAPEWHCSKLKLRF